MYDVIQLRKSSLGYRLLVKRRSTMAEMESLTAARLRDAATRLSNGCSIDDPAVLTLLQKLTAIGNPVPQSFAEKRRMRSHMTGGTIRSGTYTLPKTDHARVRVR
jgi:hypothetical protein